MTLYLHAAAPVGNADQALALVGVAAEPRMDPTAPTGLVAKVTSPTPLGNTAAGENALLAYWVGDVRGELRSAVARVHAQSQQSGSQAITFTLFDSAGPVSGVKLAERTVRAPLVPGEIVVDFGPLAAPVHGRLTLQANLTSIGVASAILYDSVDRPSSLTIAVAPLENEPGPSWTPKPGWSQVHVISTTLSHRETSLAISPVDPNLMIACAPSGVPNTQYGSSYFHVSRDGGVTWLPLDVETGATDPRRFAFEGGDCDVAFDAGGTMYAADTWLGSLSVGSSSDGGYTWTGTSLAASSPVVDRPWLVGGPDGTMHLAYQDVQAAMPSLIWYARTDDHGLTWTPAVPITTANAGGLGTWEGNLVVSPDQQTMHLVYTRRLLTVGGTAGEKVWVARSEDGGQTWTSNLAATRPNSASYLYPSIGEDTSGRLHVVYTSGTGADRPVWYTTSSDGVAWSTPKKVMAGIATYGPWVVGGEAGEAAIQWYGSPDPQATTSTTSDWYFYAARVKDGVVTSAGTTTVEPIFHGTTSMPEFNQVRLSANGKMHLGASAYHTSGDSTGWALFHQNEV